MSAPLRSKRFEDLPHSESASLYLRRWTALRRLNCTCKLVQGMLGCGRASVAEICDIARANLRDGTGSAAVECIASLGGFGQFEANQARDLERWVKGLYGVDLEPFNVKMTLNAPHTECLARKLKAHRSLAVMSCVMSHKRSRLLGKLLHLNKMCHSFCLTRCCIRCGKRVSIRPDWNKHVTSVCATYCCSLSVFHPFVSTAAVSPVNDRTSIPRSSANLLEPLLNTG